MPEQSNNDGYVEPSNLARAVVVSLIVACALALWLIMPVLDQLGPVPDSTAAELGASIARLFRFLEYAMLFSIILSVVLSGYFIQLALRIKRFGTYPPPGARVIRRTRVRSGREAVKMLVLAYFMAAFCWFPVLITGYVQWLLTALTQGW